MPNFGIFLQLTHSGIHFKIHLYSEVLVMKKINLHSHTTYCDGLNTAEEMVLAAIEKGFDTFGFSGHSYIDFDDSWCMSLESTKEYFTEIQLLKEKYNNQITILCGVEQDYLSETSIEEYDYVIGSVHVIPKNGEYISVDYTAESLIDNINKHYNGDALSLAEDYFEMIGNVYKKTKCHIVGHFDLLTKFNEKTPIFDTSHPRYIKAAEKALSKLLDDNVIFEVNTGAISRGYRTSPYPSKELLLKIKEAGGKVILSSDTHSIKTVDAGYEDAIALLKDCGFTI